MQPVWAIGLMTGTVLDGMIDIAMIKTCGQKIVEFGPYALQPYSHAIRKQLLAAVQTAREWRFQGPKPELLQKTEAALTQAQTEAVQQFLLDHGLSSQQIAVIGFHGQTVLHQAPHHGGIGQTCQLGDGQAMANALGIDVVYDFRSADMAAGGQGAPLAAVYHQTLLDKIGQNGRTAMLNLGGIGNLTYVDPATSEPIAFDTGPANAPLNDWVQQHEQGLMDVDGKIAAQGQVCEQKLERLLQNDYFSQAYPKSLDRYSFLADMVNDLSLEDGAATLTAFCAAAVNQGLELLPERPQRLIVSGGGRKNPSLMAALATRTNTQVLSADDVGLRGDAIEAECFAFLAVRALQGLPISFPLTTGIASPMTGGKIVRPIGASAEEAEPI